jgi:hypothetical protein
MASYQKEYIQLDHFEHSIESFIPSLLLSILCVIIAYDTLWDELSERIGVDTLIG